MFCYDRVQSRPSCPESRPVSTILFQGEPIERHLLRQRIAADRLEPLSLPLTDEQAAQLIDVQTEGAWLSFAIS